MTLPSPLPAAPRKVLIADDNADAAESLAMLLELDGHEVRVARDGLQALAVAEAFRPDVILLDIGMPALDGHGVARRLRGERWGAAIYLVALSGRGHEEDKRRALEAGFDRHVTKPLDLALLETLLGAGNPPG